jgi:hypothetical protein
VTRRLSSPIRALRPASVAVFVALAVGVTGCSVSGSATSEDDAAGGGNASAPLPAAPQFSGAATVCSGGSVVGTTDITHPGWGPTRIFAITTAAGSGGGEACLVAQNAAGVQWSHAEDSGPTTVKWRFANPATDNTGNTFVIYNPGRYDGVIVLVPTADGFAPIEQSYQTGQNRYYYAELVGPQGGRYAIEASANDCEPDCASGTITRRTLQWNGSTYS